MDTIEHWGEWWVPVEDDERWQPKNAEDRISGVLEFDPSNGGELDLMGTLTGIGGGPEDIDTIHGKTKDGEFVTLRGLFDKGTGMSASATVMRNQKFGISKVFSGALFYDKPEFSEVELTLPLLEMWMRDEVFSIQLPQTHEKLGASVEGVEPITAELENADVKLSLGYNFNKKNWESVEISQTAKITISPDEKLPFERILNEYARHIQNLLCLAIGEPIDPKSVVGVNPSEQEEVEKHKTDITYRISHPAEAPGSKHPDSVLFSLPDIEFEDALQKWFESARGAQTLHNLYFGTKYNESMFEENRFLSLAIAIEGFHSYLFPDHRIIEESSYDDLHEDILEVIPDGTEIENRIDGLLGSIGNHPSLRNKIEMVFSEYDHILSELIDVDRVAKRTTDNRHNLAHALDDGVDTVAVGDLARTLQVVIEAILMDAIGLDSDYIIDTPRE
ncbi:hypothetical protein EXE49_16340 [Halorubrum sp. ASP121]|uniref:ApeA N-terminal domain 1-containing protein n=1 Tax=Halorubrum sp. ASP121 TaxID=1855858 RepID=UPI0010FA01E7|nr:HEPN domain-containing protein [Halorubrum sp. ASP121]TKX48307.1 hypothetical protein EXE49_16340 [Halorubrum sp. ASP121]